MGEPGTEAATGPDGGTLPAPPARETVRARLSVCLVFLIMGATMGGWSARIPEVRREVGLGETAWGLATTASVAGDFVALAVITVLIGRVSLRRLSLAGAVLILLNAPLMGSASATAVLLAALATWGFAANLLSTPMNAQAAEVERRYGRPLLSTFHACFAFGMLGGGALGTLAAAAGVPPGTQMAAVSLLLGSLLAVSGRWLPEETGGEEDTDDTGRPRREQGEERLAARLRRRLTPQLALLAAIAFLDSFAEGAAGQWSAIYAADFLGTGEAVAAAIYTGLTATAAFTRLVGDRLTGRLGHRLLLRVSLLTAAAGMGAALVWPHPAVALAGFAVFGVGTACVLPTVFALAGRQPGLSAGEGVSVAVIGQWPGLLLAGPLVGLLAGVWDLRIALLSLVAAALAAALLAGRVVE
ncbi:MFS transporter [Streptomyces sp. TRM 70361]|uniref:MFS transporter n=1 Tax=Streptomyces sp. TRM 70361 TaxID=3116553 RepID=UPI002E7B7378|nr:MFS transporter [Streptomyces sp. TRM 70361]MEE1943392.1 MFS transporter [Streptomyces sp. TRM 70361]